MGIRIKEDKRGKDNRREWYSIGDTFLYADGDIYCLVRPTYGYCQLIDIMNGNRFDEMVEMKGPIMVSRKEFDEVSCGKADLFEPIDLEVTIAARYKDGY